MISPRSTASPRSWGAHRKEQILGPLDNRARKSRDAQTGQEGRKLPRRGPRDRPQSSGAAGRGMCGAQPRLYTMIVRLKVVTTCPSYVDDVARRTLLYLRVRAPLRQRALLGVGAPAPWYIVTASQE
jgi:hypothetical protein